MYVVGFYYIITFVLSFVTAGCEIPCADIVYVVDISISIGGEGNFRLVKDFINNTFDVVNISPTCSRAAVVLFARDATINFTLGEHPDRASAEEALYQIIITEYARGKGDVRHGTNTPAALNLLRERSQELGVRPNVPSVVLFITDGNPWVPSIRENKNLTKQEMRELEDERTKNAANRLKNSGIYHEIWAIGIENKKGNLGDTLSIIAKPSNRTFDVSGFNESVFNELEQRIIDQFCKRK